MGRWPPVDKRENDKVILIVDETGAGTYKTVEEAMQDASDHPKRVTMVKIIPHTTIENFERPEGPGGGDV